MSLVSVLQKRKVVLDAIADVNSYFQVKHGLRKALEEAVRRPLSVMDAHGLGLIAAKR